MSRKPSHTPLHTHLGQRLRARRREARWSMDALGEAIGVTYQQIQKYETGANRLSASTLYQIAAALKVPVADFYADLPDAASADSSRYADQVRFENLMATAGGREMLEAFLALPAHLRRPLLELACGLRDRAPQEDGVNVVRLPTWR